jgi:hypothetical protein
MHNTFNEKKEKKTMKLNEKNLLMNLEEYTKYFDLCYWRERRMNPESPDLDDWTASKIRHYQKYCFGEKNDQH